MEQLAEPVGLVEKPTDEECAELGDAIVSAQNSIKATGKPLWPAEKLYIVEIYIYMYGQMGMPFFPPCVSFFQPCIFMFFSTWGVFFSTFGFCFDLVCLSFNFVSFFNLGCIRYPLALAGGRCPHARARGRRCAEKETKRLKKKTSKVETNTNKVGKKIQG